MALTACSKSLMGCVVLEYRGMAASGHRSRSATGCEGWGKHQQEPGKKFSEFASGETKSRLPTIMMGHQKPN